MFSLERNLAFAQTSCEIYGTTACPSTLLQVENVPTVSEQLAEDDMYGDIPEYLLIDAKKKTDGTWRNYEV